MNDEVRKAVDSLDQSMEGAHQPTERNWQTIRAELIRLTEIADSVDPPVVQLEAANALLRRSVVGVAWGERDPLLSAIQAHLSEPRT